MANLIKKNTEPPRKKNPRAFAAGIISVAAFIAGLLWYEKTNIIAGLVICVLASAAFVLCVVIFFSRKDESASKWYGNIGESRTGMLFKEALPNDYIVIQNAVVEYDGAKSEIDDIIIGKTGIYVVEVKNMKGKIYADIKSKRWRQDKKDSHNVRHEREFYSPVKQVATHVYRLGNYLKENGIDVWITGIVYFVNPESKLIIKNKTIDKPLVYRYGQEKRMISYILDGREQLTDEQIQKIFELLR